MSRNKEKAVRRSNLTAYFFVDIFHVRFAVVYALGVILVPEEFLAQALFERCGIGHEGGLSADVENVFVVVEAEVVALGDGLFDADEPRLFASGGITKLDPFADGDDLTITDVEDVFLRMLLEQYFDEAAQVGDVEELELHFAVLREIKGSVEHGAVENKGFAVEVLVESVEVRRAQDVGLRDVFCQVSFGAQLVHAVIAPDRVLAAGLIFGERLRIRLGINGAGADEDVVVELHARSDQRADVLFGVGGDIEDDVEMPTA